MQNQDLTIIKFGMGATIDMHAIELQAVEMRYYTTVHTTTTSNTS